MKQSINTEALDAAVGTLRTSSSNLNAAFEKVSRHTSTLGSCWQSGAGSKAETTLYQLSKANEDRDAILQNYILVLTQVVEQGYLMAEEANTSLADYFK